MSINFRDLAIDLKQKRKGQGHDPSKSGTCGDGEPIILTAGQQDAVDMLEKFFDSDENYASITGSAGCGKTFMLRKALDYIDVSRIGFTAPTNKAVDVLAKVMPGGAQLMTLHRFLGLTVVFPRGKPVLARKDDFDPEENRMFRVIMVDEASMLDEQLMAFIAADIKYSNRKYVFIGDHCQLPPVEGNKRYSGSFDVAAEAYRVTLTEIVRQAADNPIIKVATAIRDAIDTGKEPRIFGGVNEETGQGVHLLDRLAFNAKLEEVVNDPRIHTDVDYCRVVAWRNTTCRTVNQHVRKLLGEDTSRPFSVGDIVVVNSAYSLARQVVVGTGDEVVINYMEEHTHEDYRWRGFAVELSDSRSHDNLPHGLHCIADEHVQELEDTLEALRQAALADRSKWYEFYQLKEFYIDIRPPYALTAHKAQGSTFENVFVHYKDIYANRRKITADKCYYVAVTRASKNVYILY